MSNFRDDGSDAPLGRDLGGTPGATSGATVVTHQPAAQYPPQQHGPQHYGAPYGQQPYGYGSPYAPRMRRQYPIETKPFFLTSEFVASVLAVAGIAITAAASDAFGAWRAWILITAVVVGYMVSRGIAKSGTRSNSSDPREQLDLFRRDGGDDHS
jgi:hypothetical protein